ncbi:hypothetical protein, partial [Rhizobium sp. No.120]
MLLVVRKSGFPSPLRQTARIRSQQAIAKEYFQFNDRLGVHVFPASGGSAYRAAVNRCRYTNG